MSSDETVSEFVRSLAAAPTLAELPDVADPVNRAPQNPPQRIQQKFVGSSY
jgi:hypothetical protein